jgi:hypothetical protein
MSTLSQSNALTAGSATAVIFVPSIAPAGHTIQGEFLDNAYGIGDVTNKELKMTLQSVVKGGWIPQMKEVTITLLPNTPSWQFFNDWYQAEEATHEVLECQSLIITLPSIGQVTTYTNGFLTTAKVMPDIKKILQEGSFKLTFGHVVTVSL